MKIRKTAQNLINALKYKQNAWLLDKTSISDISLKFYDKWSLINGKSIGPFKLNNQEQKLIKPIFEKIVKDLRLKFKKQKMSQDLSDLKSLNNWLTGKLKYDSCE